MLHPRPLISTVEVGSNYSFPVTLRIPHRWPRGLASYEFNDAVFTATISNSQDSFFDVGDSCRSVTRSSKFTSMVVDELCFARADEELCVTSPSCRYGRIDYSVSAAETEMWLPAKANPFIEVKAIAVNAKTTVEIEVSTGIAVGGTRNP